MNILYLLIQNPLFALKTFYHFSKNILTILKEIYGFMFCYGKGDAFNILKSKKTKVKTITYYLL